MKKHPINGARVRSRALRQNMTGAEKQIWQILRSRQMNGYRFRRQVALGRYIAPTLTLPRLRGREGWGCHETRLIVEIDGGQHDRSSRQEVARSRFLENEGYRILRFWNNEVLENLDGVRETIVDELSRITPTPTLPHQGGGL